MKLLLIAAIVLYLFGSFRRPVFIAALTLQLIYLGLRGAALGRLPLIGPQDTLTFFSASIGLMAIPFLYARDLRSSSTFSWGTGCLAGLFALMALPFPTLNMPLPPILNTYWFELHVALAFFAYALFGIGALLAGMFLRYREKSLLDLQYKTALVATVSSPPPWSQEASGVITPGEHTGCGRQRSCGPPYSGFSTASICICVCRAPNGNEQSPGLPLSASALLSLPTSGSAC